MKKLICGRRRAILLGLCLLLLPAALVAQENTGNLEVLVIDAQDKPLPGVSLTVVVDGKPQVRETDAGGQASFNSLPAGDYSVEASAEGFATSKTPVVITIARNTDLKIVLQPAVSGGQPASGIPRKS